MQSPPSNLSPARLAVWVALLTAASVAFSLGFACAVPLAAFAAIAALTLRPAHAFLLVGAVWLANQVAGFCVLGFPLDRATIDGGIHLGLVAIAATLLALALASRFERLGPPAAYPAAFAGAFIAYEGGLFVISTLMDNPEDYTAPTVARIFAINLCAFAGLAILNRLAGRSAPPKLVLESRPA